MDRTGFIGGSDAARIVEGDWFTLWQEKTSRAPALDLTHNFQAQLGKATETFHLGWLNTHQGFNIESRAGAWVHPDHHYIQANLDGWCHTRDTFVDAKHTHTGATRDVMVQRYLPQFAHYCLVTASTHGWLSYIAGNEAPDFFKIEPSPAYLEALLEAEHAFWWHVLNDSPPDRLGLEAEPTRARAAAAAKDTKIDDMRVVDMTGNNEWAAAATQYLEMKDTAAYFEKAKASLKRMVEPDVRIAAGHGLILKRNKAGSILITETDT
jgi:hypothetical protein